MIERVFDQMDNGQKKKIYLMTLRVMLNMVGVEKSVRDEDGDWHIVLLDGTKLYGHKPSKTELEMYDYLKDELPCSINMHTFPIAKQAITSYYYPHSMPTQTMEFPLEIRELFGLRQADTIDDMCEDDDEKKKQLNTIFTPRMGETFVEVGSFIGLSTIKHAQLLGDKSNIVAIEADANNYSILRKNLMVNSIKNVIAINKAVGDSDGWIELHSIGRMGTTAFAEIIGKPKTKFDIEVVKLDTLLQDLSIQNVHHISITVNGFEPEVVQGMSKTIQKSDHLRVTAAGWYDRNGEKVSDLLNCHLESDGLNVLVGKRRRVIAWK